MNRNRKNILAVILILLIVILAGASIYVASRVGQRQPIAPTAPVSEPMACDAQCPATANPNLLLSCTPSADGSLQSLCNAAGRSEPCGGQTYCCPAAGGTWTTDMTACTAAPTAGPTVTVTSAGTTAECAACVSDAACAGGMKCDTADGLCKKRDGTSVCWVGSAACTLTATSLCVPSAVKTCSPDCPTECGKPASTISTCTNSCGVVTTKACTATNACADEVEVIKRAFENESGSTATSYKYETEIDTVSKNQTFVYAITIENTSEVDATGVTITDTLNGDHQDLLTFLDANSPCIYSATDKKLTCSGLTINAGETVSYAFRVKVGDGAVNGDVIKNTGIVRVNGTDIPAVNQVTVSTIVSCNHTCTGDTECGTGLICDSATNSCRKEACTEVENCNCAPVVTERPIVVRVTRAPRVVTEAPEVERPIVVVEPTALPEAGILDFPGVAAFGGGLLLAIIGILLAL